MGCGPSKEEVDTTHAPIKIKRKSKKSRDLKDKLNQLVLQKEELENQSNQSRANEELGNSDSTVEELICDGISGKTEYLSPKRSDNFNEKGKAKEMKLEKLRIGESSRNLTIEDVICDGISGETEYHSPKKSIDYDKKDENNSNQNGNRNESLSIEGVICDGLSGNSVYYSPKKSNDEIVVEDKEVLVEEITAETEDVKIGKTEKIEDGNELSSKGKENETDTTVHVSGFAFDHLLSLWKTREV